MEVYGPNGTISVLFNGTVVNCTHDADCPDQAGCVTGYGWLPNPDQGMCTCLLALAKYGDQCENLYPAAWGMIVLILCALVLAFTAMLMTCHVGLRWIKQRKRWVWSASQTTMALLCCGSICMQTFLWLGLAEEFMWNIRVVRKPGGNVETAGPDWHFRSGFVASSFWFITFGLLNISVIWIEVAYATERLMTIRASNNIRRYRWAVALYYAVFGVAIIYFVQVDQLNDITYLVIPSVLVIIGTFFYGYRKMRGVMARILVNSSTSSGGSRPVTSTRLTVVLRKTTQTVLSSLSSRKSVSSKGGGSGAVESRLSKVEEPTDDDVNAPREQSVVSSSTALLSHKDSKTYRAHAIMARCAIRIVTFGFLGLVFNALQIVPSIYYGSTPSMPLMFILGWVSWICWAMCLWLGARYIHELTTPASPATGL